MLVRATVALASIATTITAPILLLALRSAALLAVFFRISRWFRIILGIFAFLPGIPFGRSNDFLCQLRLPIHLSLSLSPLMSGLGGQRCSPPSLVASVVFALGAFLSVAEVLYLLFPPPATGVVSSCCASLVCFFCYSWYTCGFSNRCHVAGCPSGVPLLANLFRMAGRTGSAPLSPLVMVVVGTS